VFQQRRRVRAYIFDVRREDARAPRFSSPAPTPNSWPKLFAEGNAGKSTTASSSSRRVRRSPATLGFAFAKIGVDFPRLAVRYGRPPGRACADSALQAVVNELQGEMKRSTSFHWSPDCDLVVNALRARRKSPRS